MSSPNWDRLWRSAGIQFVASFVIACVIYGHLPEVSASADELVGFYRSSQRVRSARGRRQRSDQVRDSMTGGMCLAYGEPLAGSAGRTDSGCDGNWPVLRSSLDGS
jgi:hypothetical protein